MDNNIPVLPETRTSRCMFRVATRQALPLRIGIAGPSGAGKTLGALRLAAGLTNGDYSRIFMINTEPLLNALGYVDDPTFGIGEYLYYHLDPPYNVKIVTTLMGNAVDSGASVIILDTFTQLWAGRGGVRDIHDNLDGNPFTNWKVVNPIWEEIMDYLTYECPVHVICTIRSQIKYVMDEMLIQGRKKTVVNMVGLAPILRPETEYEFPLYFNIRRDDHRAEIVTMRGNMMDVDPILNDVELTEQLGGQLREWSGSGDTYIPFERPLVNHQESLKVPTLTSGRGNNGGSGGNGKAQPVVLYGVEYNLFWKLVYALAAVNKLTTTEARPIITEALQTNDNDGKATIKYLLIEWNIDLTTLDSSVIQMLKTAGHLAGSDQNVILEPAEDKMPSDAPPNKSKPYGRIPQPRPPKPGKI